MPGSSTHHKVRETAPSDSPKPSVVTMARLRSPTREVSLFQQYHQTSWKLLVKAQSYTRVLTGNSTVLIPVLSRSDQSKAKQDCLRPRVRVLTYWLDKISRLLSSHLLLNLIIKASYVSLLDTGKLRKERLLVVDYSKAHPNIDLPLLDLLKEALRFLRTSLMK
jgi:hypothetical protein